MPTTDRTPQWLLAGGALIAAIGIYLGATPIHNCGSPWSPDWTAADKEARIGRLTGAMTGLGYDQDPRQACRDAFGSRGTLGTGLLVLGAGTATAGAILRSKRKPGDEPAASDTPTGA